MNVEFNPPQKKRDLILNVSVEINESKTPPSQVDDGAVAPSRASPLAYLLVNMIVLAV